jgi:uncharacterized protein YjbJ (UPF0337 family)
MTDDRIAGTATNFGGKVQEAYGSVSGDFAQKAKGKLNQAEGAAQEMYGQAKDMANDAVDMAGRAVREADDYVRNIIEERPYTIALAALAIGFLLGRTGRH